MDSYPYYGFCVRFSDALTNHNKTNNDVSNLNSHAFIGCTLPKISPNNDALIYQILNSLISCFHSTKFSIKYI
jgi:hypothetical protein